MKSKKELNYQPIFLYDGRGWRGCSNKRKEVNMSFIALFWWSIFGLACPIALATQGGYWLLFLLAIPALLIEAHFVFDRVGWAA